MEREPSGFPFLEINNILTQLKCLQLVKKVDHFFDKLRFLFRCTFCPEKCHGCIHTSDFPPAGLPGFFRTAPPLSPPLVKILFQIEKNTCNYVPNLLIYHSMLHKKLHGGVFCVSVYFVIARR